MFDGKNLGSRWRSFSSSHHWGEEEREKEKEDGMTFRPLST